MSDGFEYDEEAARREVAAYRTDAAARRRAAVRDGLALGGDETVLSVGCGPGFEPAELAEVLDAEARVIGFDRSEPMLDLALEQCADVAALCRGDATALPIADGAADAATAVQVLQYVPDPSTALAELRRVLSAEGRAVVLDTDWRTAIWRADDDARSRAVLDAWIDEVPNPRIGSALGPLLRDAGFAVEAVEPFPIVQRTLEDSFVGHLLPFLVDVAVESDGLGTDAARAWREDVLAREERGDTFVSVAQYRYVATVR